MQKLPLSLSLSLAFKGNNMFARKTTKQNKKQQQKSHKTDYIQNGYLDVDSVLRESH